ncbi:putative iron-regulated membrane protein [Flavobacterium sp. 2755]|uniref:PepSY-associated TM helix domain-containing protein n=1 Tax=Flavobacterium sp. 2755 TaxID=2817765 RepID=UPI002861B045|nr:PepSY-associated TM helix domain-containing protein [Flavobacterium sp. 2755]MDR6761128.1 putative iron-regulated membrane protein [Flavobacterium sp. 2755]
MSSTKNTKNPKPKSKTTFRKINDWLHLWLGLISGGIVLVVCLTACIWIFNEEIIGLIDSKSNTKIEQKTLLTPSQILEISTKKFPHTKVESAIFKEGRTIDVEIGKWEAKERYTLKLNPYSGQIVDLETHHKDEFVFFDWILKGHRFLWLPWEIGRPIVNYATLVFVVLLITGIIWWYPKKWNKTTRDKSFKIKWKANWKRVNIDLHNVLGFYSLLFLLAIALTGMVWGIEWYSEGLYWTTSGGETLTEWKEKESDSLSKRKYHDVKEVMDACWKNVLVNNPKAQGFYYRFPDAKNTKEAIYMMAYPNKGQFYNANFYYFDKYTAKRIVDGGIDSKNYDEVGFGGKLRKMNYDIHIGTILGFPGKVLAFFAALIGASLPITGFIVWYNRKWGKRKAKKQ